MSVQVSLDQPVLLGPEQWREPREGSERSGTDLLVGPSSEALAEEPHPPARLRVTRRELEQAFVVASRPGELAETTCSAGLVADPSYQRSVRLGGRLRLFGHLVTTDLLTRVTFPRLRVTHAYLIC